MRWSSNKASNKRRKIWVIEIGLQLLIDIESFFGMRIVWTRFHCVGVIPKRRHELNKQASKVINGVSIRCWRSLTCIPSGPADFLAEYRLILKAMSSGEKNVSRLWWFVIIGRFVGESLW